MTPVVATPPPTLAPMATTQAPTSAGPGWGTYVVKSGDSPYTIAQRHHTTVSALVARNKLPNGGRLIHPGQQLQVPGAGSAAKRSATPAATASSAPR